MAISKSKKNWVKTKNMTKEDWLKLRKQSIGGSDCGAILGMNEYMSAYDLWLKKRNPEIKEEPKNSEAIYWGHNLEDVVAKEFERRTGKKVRNHNFMMYHDEYPFISANVDRVVVAENAILECKTASEFKKSEWADDNIPGSYMAQCYHYMAVTGADRAYIACLIGGSHFVWKIIERDNEIIEEIIKAEVDFWNNHVVPDIEPPVDDSNATAQALNRRWQETLAKTVEIESEQATLFKAIDAINKQTKELEKQKRGYENQLKAILGENERGVTDGYEVSWKPQQSKRIDTKRLKEEQPEIYRKYIKESKSRPFKIKNTNG
ncbi:YqaJ viral recombinase family protein [Staphylococcus chromogenes]|uniref:YqaJ viral recombinase family nuclease n=1 Tax=Staphylococcus chromogenes TaxID=46126 RepID=UPI002DB7AD44|nr:YqaJ viral recombinase family protein [Staphylococcus chromogenes]MEB7449914.1 YqaJ viral recombinase family protein [Staphylococcus chromogenes]